MKLASLMTLLGTLVAGVAAVVRMVGEENLGADFPEVLAVVAFPFVLSALGIPVVLAIRKRRMWAMASLAVVYVLLTAFSVGPYFWYWAGGYVLAALLLQMTSARRGAEAADGGISSVRS